jgi:hypothetical protein
MSVSLEEAKQILDLNPHGRIASEVTDRQLEVITKSYNYLSRSKSNNLIYIADEVGLGKTYIALGIITLFRHFKKATRQKDLIIVPKKNLQNKWQKELGLFLEQNYIAKPGGRNSNLPITNSICEKLEIVTAVNDINIFRMSSFSNIVYMNEDENSPRKLQVKDLLVNTVFKDHAYCVKCINEAWEKKYFVKENHFRLRRLLAYLYNIASTPIDCLVIDEAHNYRHGPDDERHQASIRNEVTSRFLGAVSDEKLFEAFPGLKQHIKFPLAKKVVCLSATPKDTDLTEIKKQFDCFANKHVLSKTKCPDDIKSLLSTFLIRGNMEYRVGGKMISRNQSREEHRKGNINKSEKPEVITIKDDFEGVFWQLLQYQSLKHLNIKNGAQFEIGMLAGFESYSLDAGKHWTKSISNQRDREYDLFAHKNKKESEDANVVREIIDSYSKTFKHELPPHPKQSKFESEILKQLSRQEKSLTFVRRVATAHELEQRILHCYEKDVIVGDLLNFKGQFKKYDSQKVQAMISSWSEKDTYTKLPEFFLNFLQRSRIKKAWSELGFVTDQQFIEVMVSAYRNDSLLKNFVDSILLKGLTRYPAALDDHVVTIMSQPRNEPIQDDEIDEELAQDVADSNEGDDKYFFNQYFSKGRDGFKFRNILYKNNWFDFNLVLLNNSFKIFDFDQDKLTEHLESFSPSKAPAHKVFEEYQDYLKDWLKENGEVALNTELAGTIAPTKHSIDTFLTRLVIYHCSSEFEDWLRRKASFDNVEELLNELDVLGMIFKSIMRNGSGLLPSFVAHSSGEDFSEAMNTLLTDPEGPFNFVLEELRTIIVDFDLIYTQNFKNKSLKEIANMHKGLSPVIGVSGIVKRDRSLIAAQFRMPGYPYVLISTDILREGEDLHTYCQNVYHYGIAWNPSDMEQRTGRIDRINSMSYRKLHKNQSLDFDNKIQVFYPYLSQSIEVNQVVKLLNNINLFMQTFNDISSTVKFDTSASVDDQIDSIPKAIQEKIEAKYDIQNFDRQNGEYDNGKIKE